MKPIMHFHPALRIVHWLMALAIISMLFIGVALVASVSQWHSFLLSLHKPLGIAIFLLVIIRIGLRIKYKTPPLPHHLPIWQKGIGHATHGLLYLLMIAQPLIGWAMLSAGGYPITLGFQWVLPPIISVNNDLYVFFHSLHVWISRLLFLVILFHLAAALLHGLILRDGVFSQMLRGKGRSL